MAVEVENPAFVSSEISVAVDRYTNSDYFRRHAKSDSSRYAYQADLGLFTGYLSSVGIFSCGDLKMDHVADWVGKMSGRRGTVERRLSSAKTFLNWLVENNLSQEDFSAKIPLSGYRAADGFEVLGHDRYMALVEHLRQQGELRDLAIVELLMSTGADASEVVNMKISDVRKLKNGATAARFVKPRTGVERVNILSDSAARAIEEYLAQRQNRAKNKPLFVSRRGRIYTDKGLTRAALWLILQRYKSVAGVGCLNTRVFTNTRADNFEGNAKDLADFLGIGVSAARELRRNCQRF